MPDHIILQHNCRRPELDDGLPFHCHCAHKISLKHARRLVESGMAVWKLRRNVNGRLIRDKSTVILRHKPRIKHPRMINDDDIEVAYVLDMAAERQRIEDWRWLLCLDRARPKVLSILCNIPTA